MCYDCDSYVFRVFFFIVIQYGFRFFFLVIQSSYYIFHLLARVNFLVLWLRLLWKWLYLNLSNQTFFNWVRILYLGFYKFHVRYSFKISSARCSRECNCHTLGWVRIYFFASAFLWCLAKSCTFQYLADLDDHGFLFVVGVWLHSTQHALCALIFHATHNLVLCPFQRYNI